MQFKASQSREETKVSKINAEQYRSIMINAGYIRSKKRDLMFCIQVASFRG
jgi:hypothetical protein